LLHISWNDIGPEAAQHLIDDFSRVMSQWTLVYGFSVGVRDIEMKVDIIAEVEGLKTFYMNQAYELIEGLNAGDYEATRKRIIGQPRGLTENWYEQFEQDMDHVLRTCKSKIESLTVKNIDIDHDGKPYDNRFMSMVNSGSKGNNVNLVQIVSILGQQDIAGGRVPDYYRRRPLAFMPKDDLSPESRGMITSSYLVGLTLSEFIYHAMAGRLGMISTSIKTADTGYLQRKLVKLLEDLKCQYDFTIRSNSGRILQYVYGGDCFDGSHVEHQSITHLTYGMEDVLLTYAYTAADWTTFKTIHLSTVTPSDMDDAKEKKAVSDEITTIVDDWTYMRAKFRDNIPKTITSVVNFDRLIKTVKNRLRSTGSVPYLRGVDVLYPSYVYESLKKLESEIYLPTAKSLSDHCLRGFFVLLRSKLASKIMIFQEGFNKTGFNDLLTEIKIKFYRGLVAPGEAVGVIAAQSIGEPSTQITLDAFHSTGSKVSVSGGVPRLKEILSLTKMKTPSDIIYLQNVPIPAEVTTVTGGMSVNEYLGTLNSVTKISDDVKSARAGAKMQIQELIMKHAVLKIKSQFEFVKFSNMVSKSEIRYIENFTDPDLDVYEDIIGYNELHGEAAPLSSWFLKFDLNENIVAEHNLRMETIVDILKASHKNLTIIHALPNSQLWYVLVNVPNLISDPMTALSELEETILSTRIKGVKDINRAMIRMPPRKDIKLPSGRIVQVGTKEYTKIVDNYINSEDYIVDTYGTNLIDIMSMPHVDPYRTYSNNITEMYEMFGIEVARRAIIREIVEVFSGAGVTFDVRHIELLADNMTSRGLLQKVDRIGAKTSESGPLSLACFEETTTHLCKAAAFGGVDQMKGVSANIMHGQLIKIGTGAFDMYMDEAMIISEAQEEPALEEGGMNVISKESFSYCSANNFQFKFNL
jgi:DNA-directed RNA polymerase II subunit RPB1